MPRTPKKPEGKVIIQATIFGDITVYLCAHKNGATDWIDGSYGKKHAIRFDSEKSAKVFVAAGAPKSTVFLKV